MIIDSTGAAAPCCYWGAYENLNGPVGNVKEQSIEEIWNGPAYQKLREGMARGDLRAAGCANCHAVKQGLSLGFDYDSDADGDDKTSHGRNIAVLKHEIGRGAIVLEAKPTIISYTPSHRCNIRCTHCYQESTREAEIKRVDAADEIERLVPYLVRLIAGGGEPFLLPIWRRFLANFDTGKNPYLDFGTSTNATVVTNAVLAGLGRFKHMTINVSLDGTGAVYERVRIGAKFEEVKANIRKLKEVVLSAPSRKANIGISMCVMKSNILDLPNLVRFARDEELQFGMSPVISMPPDESLRCFNDPAMDMAGWSDAIDAAKAELDSYFLSLAKIWRIQEVEENQKTTWRNLFEVLREQIPFDVIKIPHRQVTIDLPKTLITLAVAKHGNQPLVAYISRQNETSGVSYWGPIKGGRCQVSLPNGVFSVRISTKWTAAVSNGEGDFTVGSSPLGSPIAVRHTNTSRYTPRRMAKGALRRAKLLVNGFG